MSNWKPGKGFALMLNQTRKADVKRRVERELKATGHVRIPKDASERDVNDILDAGSELACEREEQQELYEPEQAFGCICNRPFHACDCGAAVAQERMEG